MQSLKDHANTASANTALCRYKKSTGTCTGILCPCWYKTLVYWLMQKSVSAFCLFSTGDSSNNKGWWWFFICSDMLEELPATLTTELHCLHTATSAWIRPSVFRLCRLKCFERSDFPLVLGTRRYSNSHVSTMLMRRWSFPWPFKQFWHFTMSFLEITEYTGTAH